MFLHPRSPHNRCPRPLSRSPWGRPTCTHRSCRSHPAELVVPGPGGPSEDPDCDGSGGAKTGAKTAIVTMKEIMTRPMRAVLLETRDRSLRPVIWTVVENGPLWPRNKMPGLRPLSMDLVPDKISLQPDPWVQIGVQYVHCQVYHEEQKRSKEHEPHYRRCIKARDRVRCPTSDAWPLEHIFGDHVPAQ